MFNYLFNQNVVVPNNFCGGYSLAAIATVLTGNMHFPMNVYSELLHVQNANNNPINEASRLINMMRPLGNGTDPLLPSTFVRANYNNFNYDIFIAQANAALNGIRNTIDMNQVVIDESVNLGLNGNIPHTNDNLANLLQNDHNNNHWLVLVNNASHWVAIDRVIINNNNIQYSIYNPSDAINDDITIVNNGITYNNNHHVPEIWSGIAIGVR